MLDYIYNRHSVREFQDKDIPEEDLKEILKAAMQAPSGRNLQNWHFVVVQNRGKLKDIADIIKEKGKLATEKIADEKEKQKMLAYLNYYTFFPEAPVTIFVFAGPYPTTGMELFLGSNPTDQEVKDFNRHQPGIQNIGAAVQNLLLAASTLGYGGCWMTGPLYAKNEIQEYLGFKKECYHLACMVPLGVPVASELYSPPRKALGDVMTIIR